MESIDTRFETDTEFDVVTNARRIELVERATTGTFGQGLLHAGGICALGELAARLGG